ncbi:hypothetical protein Mapa_018679 [Marchantia paleacea]|nr:hypothetical protein Mapa_018679 [Marchantia paleacea]
MQCAWIAWEKVGSCGRKRCVARETRVVHEWTRVRCNAIFYVFVVMCCGFLLESLEPAKHPDSD